MTILALRMSYHVIFPLNGAQWRYCTRFRGQPYLEDNYNPGYFSIDVRTGKSKFNLVASIEFQDAHNIEYFRKYELDRIQELLTNSEIIDEFALKLVRASDSFLVHRNSTNSASVIAGYHWFSDWGRDALISLPGLTLVTKRFEELARRTMTGYAKFWNKEIGCLYDVIDVNGDHDGAVRPNQIIAVSLPFSVLSPDKEKSIVEVVQREQLTPFGLRTLSKEHPEYQEYYAGDAYSRDSAYHQGTVWPWLIGPFVTAICRVNHHSSESRIFAKEMFRPLNEHLSDAGIGSISEIFDGNYPHEPGGCISQSWSVAEILRSYIEDILSE